MVINQSTRSKTALPSRSEKDGVLEAIRLMAEKQVRKVLVLNESRKVIGAFQLEENRLKYEPMALAH